jgi:predicted small secreted protein
MKRKAALLLAVILVLSTLGLSACGTKEGGTSKDQNGAT